jgi:hypothetical protein
MGPIMQGWIAGCLFVIAVCQVVQVIQGSVPH